MDSAQEMQGLRVVLSSETQNRAFHALDGATHLVDEFEIDLDALADSGIGESFGDAFMVNLAVELMPELGQVVLAVGVLDMGEQIDAVPDEVITPAQEIASAAH